MGELSIWLWLIIVPFALAVFWPFGLAVYVIAWTLYIVLRECDCG